MNPRQTLSEEYPLALPEEHVYTIERVALTHKLIHDMPSHCVKLVIGQARSRNWYSTLQHIGKYPQLISLTMQHCRLDDSYAYAFGRLLGPHLRQLNLDYNNFTSDCANTLSQIGSIQSLSLIGNRPTLFDNTKMRVLSRLKYVAVPPFKQAVVQVSGGYMRDMPPAGHNLDFAVLNVIRCVLDSANIWIENGSVAPGVLRQLADHFPSTHTLKMRSCRINDQFLEDILPRFPNLNQLDLYNNSVTCVGIKSIMTHAPDLKILLITYNSVQDEGACYIARGLHQLKTLSMDNCRLTQEGLKWIVKNLSVSYLKAEHPNIRASLTEIDSGEYSMIRWRLLSVSCISFLNNHSRHRLRRQFQRQGLLF